MDPNDKAAFYTDNTGLGFAEAINKHLLGTSYTLGIIQDIWIIALTNQLPIPMELTTILTEIEKEHGTSHRDTVVLSH